MKSRKVFFIAAATAMAATSIVASAAWTASGSGSGSATARSAQALTGTATSSGETLYPGGVADVKILIANPNPYAVKLTSVDFPSTISSVTGGGAGCTVSTTGVSFTDVTDTNGIATVPANATAFELTLTDKASMTNSSHTDCQGATFGVTGVSLGGESFVAP